MYIYHRAIWAVLALGIGLLVVFADNLTATNTKLGLFEMRISNIPAEFERRVPAFRSTWKAFKLCVEVQERGNRCDPTAILLDRDAVVEATWPEVFDRLMVHGDWGEYSQSFLAHEEFLDALEEYGAEWLRNKCVPTIHFRIVGGRPMREMMGFNCDHPGRERPG